MKTKIKDLGPLNIYLGDSRANYLFKFKIERVHTIKIDKVREKYFSLTIWRIISRLSEVFIISSQRRQHKDCVIQDNIVFLEQFQKDNNNTMFILTYNAYDTHYTSCPVTQINKQTRIVVSAFVVKVFVYNRNLKYTFDFPLNTLRKYTKFSIL